MLRRMGCLRIVVLKLPSRRVRRTAGMSGGVLQKCASDGQKVQRILPLPEGPGRHRAGGVAGRGMPKLRRFPGRTSIVDFDPASTTTYRPGSSATAVFEEEF